MNVFILIPVLYCHITGRRKQVGMWKSCFVPLRTPVLISDLTRVEFVSAIARWARMAEISEPQANLIENTFSMDGKAGLFLCKSLGVSCYQQAEKWLSARKTSMRTLDALHLACCLTEQAKMVTCDAILHQSAEMFGVPSMLI